MLEGLKKNISNLVQICSIFLQEASSAARVACIIVVLVYTHVLSHLLVADTLHCNFRLQDVQTAGTASI